MLVEDPAQRPYTRLAGVIVEGATESVRVDHVELVRLVDRALNGPRTCDGREVEEGTDRFGHRNAEVGADVAVPKTRAVMDAHAGAADLVMATHAYCDVTRMLFAEAPESSGASMAQHGIASAGKNRRHPTPLPTEMAPADEVHALRHSVEAPGLGTMFDRPLTEAQVEQLAARYDSMLSLRQTPRQPAPRFHPFPRHREEKGGNDATLP
ncbi:MAG TPA: hypothetical protein VFY75_00825 [Solirubrobacterales bacterium]|nr:hypothetical protein [Solirubrobacterales bacterium]